MRTELLIDMSLVDEEAVGHAVDYLLETVAEMRAKHLTMQEALIALGQTAAIVAAQITTAEVVH